MITYLLGGAMGDTVYFPCCYSSQIPEVRDAVRSVFGASGEGVQMQREIYAGGGFFWLKKGTSYKEIR